RCLDPKFQCSLLIDRLWAFGSPPVPQLIELFARYWVRFDSALPQKKIGIASSWNTTEKTMTAVIDLSYRKPIAALPRNQAIPKPVSKRPNAVLRFAAETTFVRTAFKRESCAPMPMLQRAMPISATLAPPRKTKGANKAERANATINMGKPIRSS